MRAVVIAQAGGLENLVIREVPTPEPGGNLVRVRVRASAVNRADLLQVRGKYPPPPGVPADIPGLEFAGEIDALGPDVTEPLRVGDRVMGIVGGGGLAEYVVVAERVLLPIPPNLDFEAAAAVPEVFLTAFDALDQRAHLEPGEGVLIHAVGGGVGTAAVQLAHAMGCPVFGTSRTGWKLERARELGLDVGIDTSAGSFAPVVLQRTGGAGVPVVIDHVGGPFLADNLAVLGVGGRLVLVGLLAGARAGIALATVLQKRLSIVGTVLRSRPLEEKIAMAQQFRARVGPWLASGRVRPVIDQVFPMAEIRAAAERLDSNAGFGKVVVRLAD